MVAPQSTTRIRLPLRTSRLLNAAARPIAPEGSEMQRSSPHKVRIASLTSAFVTVYTRSGVP